MKVWFGFFIDFRQNFLRQYHVAQAGFTLCSQNNFNTRLSASTCQLLRIQVCAIRPALCRAWDQTQSLNYVVLSIEPQLQPLKTLCRGQRSTLGVFPQKLSTLFLRQGLLLAQNLSSGMCCPARESLGSPIFYLLSTGFCKMCILRTELCSLSSTLLTNVFIQL